MTHKEATMTNRVAHPMAEARGLRDANGHLDSGGGMTEDEQGDALHSIAPIPSSESAIWSAGMHPFWMIGIGSR